MGSLTAKRRLVIYVTLIGCGLAVCGWQVQEHLRYRRAATQALINRGLDITSTLGAVLRSQRRYGIIFNKERFESALRDLVRPEELKAIAILGATGEPIASAGEPSTLAPDTLREPGLYWQGKTVTVMNLMDLDSKEDGPRSPSAIIVNEGMERAFRRPPFSRRQSDPTRNAAEGDAVAGMNAAAAATASSRPVFSRPFWMSAEDYESIMQKQGVHSLMISLSTVQMHRAVNADLLLRALVSLLAMGGAIVSALAWRNVGKNAELQIRLVKAGEMNTHLKEMNLAAAGLAHETRNPLNLIRGFAQMIAADPHVAPKLKEHASTILEEADRVTVQLNEFINYSKPREAQMAPVDVARLIADVSRTLLPDLEEKHIELRQPESSLQVEADEQLLRQALFNVLLNATQAVEPGGHIEVRLAATGPREAMLEIRDDGPGVAVADRASIFKPYVTMRPKGVGLGLAIVAQIAAVHHWEVTCTGNEPRGAVFRFSHLKLAPVPA
jgi:signal transduction histidine kinase